MMNRETSPWLWTLLLAMAVALPLVLHAQGQDFYISMISRMMIYGIAACSLNLILGFGGLVSFGHAAFLGIGAYAVGIMITENVTNGWLNFAVAMGVSALAAAVIGAISLRTRGVYFIMITLAFAQMGYFVFVSLKQFGGDDGMAVAAASNFGLFKLATANSVYFCALALLLALTLWVDQLSRSPFGMALQAGRQNARRASSLGLALRGYQLTAYVLSAVLCGVAGMLLANLNAYVSPSSMSWVVSGDLIVMVVLGGMGTVMGPVVGAFLFMCTEEVLKSWSDHWMAVFGLLIVAIAMLGKAGVVGWLQRRAALSNKENRA